MGIIVNTVKNLDSRASTVETGIGLKQELMNQNKAIDQIRMNRNYDNNLELA